MTQRFDQLDRRIIAIAVPALGSLLVEPVYVLTDTAVVGRLGTVPLAGLALASVVLNTLVWVFNFLSYGTTVRVAVRRGRGDTAGAAADALQALWLALAIGLVVLTDRPVALIASSAIVGAAVPGVVPLALGRVQELVEGDRSRKAAWSLCTAAFALGQAIAAYVFACVFERSDGGYLPLFAAGAGALLLALAIDLVWPRTPRVPQTER